MFITAENVTFVLSASLCRQNINRTFFFTWKHLNVLRGIFFVFCLLLNTLFLLFFVVQLVIPIAKSLVCRLNLEKHHSYLAFSFATIFELFYWLFWGFLAINTYTVSCFFVDKVQKCNGYLSGSILKSKKVSCTWFFVCLSLNIVLPPFSYILTRNCNNHTYLVAVYTLNTPNTPYFFVYNR